MVLLPKILMHRLSDVSIVFIAVTQAHHIPFYMKNNHRGPTPIISKSQPVQGKPSGPGALPVFTSALHPRIFPEPHDLSD